MKAYKVEKDFDNYETVSADGYQTNGSQLIFFTERPGVVTPQNPKGQKTAVPFKIYNCWISVGEAEQ